MEDLSIGFNDKLKILDNKTSLYKKEIVSLENRIKMLQEENDKKSRKLQKNIVYISQLEKENFSLKKALDNVKNKLMTEKQMFSNSKKAQEGNLMNLQSIIEKLKHENEELSHCLSVQNEEKEKLRQNLIKVSDENKQYTQDNTILVTKIQEYEENLNQLNNSMLINNKINQDSNNQIIKDVDDKIAVYTSLIRDEVNIIAKYIDTYLIFDHFNEVNIPDLRNITNFQNENNLLNFDNIISVIENVRQKLITDYQKSEQTIINLKQELGKSSSILKNKITENNELKNHLSELKKENYYLQNEFNKMKNDLTNQKGFNQQIQNNVDDISNLQDDYLKKLYFTIKKELDKILNDISLRNYTKYLINPQNNNVNINSMKNIFEDILDKYILVNNCIKEDFKKIKDKDNLLIKSELMNSDGKNINDLVTEIQNLKNKINEQATIISNNDSEKKLLINQINMLQKSSNKQSNENIKNDNYQNYGYNSDNNNNENDYDHFMAVNREKMYDRSGEKRENENGFEEEYNMSQSNNDYGNLSDEGQFRENQIHPYSSH